MSGQNYWLRGNRRISRRGLLRGAGIGAAGLAGAALIGCGGSSSPATSTAAPSGGAAAGGTATAAATQSAGSAKLTDKTLTAGIGSDVGSMDPQSLGGTGGGNWPAYATIFGGAGLATIDWNTKDSIPDVAESWEEAPDHLSWTIKLRPDVYFHDGSQLKAEDAKFSMDCNIGQAKYNPDYKAGYSAQFKGIVKSAEVIDDRTVKYNMEKPDIIFLRRPLFIVPMAYIEKVGDDGFAAKPVGAGFYKFTSRVPDSEIRAERWEKYHHPIGDKTGLHTSYIKTLIQKVIPDDQARVASLQAGELDLIHNVSSDIAKQLEGDKGFKVFYLNGDQPIMIDMNTAMDIDPTTGKPNPFIDKRVRLAANYAVDVDAIINNVLTGKERKTYGSAQSGFGFPEDLKKQTFGYDPAKAKQLLADAGYPDGFETSMFGPIGRWPNSRPVMEAVGQYLSKVGIKTSIQELQYQEVTTRVKDKTLGPLVFWGRAGGSDPGANFRYNYHSTSNFSLGTPRDITPAGDVTKEIDSLIEKSEQEYDTEKRRALLEKIITDFYLSAKSIWLYEPVTVVAAKSGWSWDIWAQTLAVPEYWNIAPSA